MNAASFMSNRVSRLLKKCDNLLMLIITDFQFYLKPFTATSRSYRIVHTETHTTFISHFEDIKNHSLFHYDNDCIATQRRRSSPFQTLHRDSRTPRNHFLPLQHITDYTAALALYILEGSRGSSRWLPRKVTVAIPGRTLKPAFEA